ncbi:hypothetical protein RPE78_14800 (plasmid) [Thioclava litoralis]|uniref:Uncharacterized protein n=1 Tax=Thioclava litoralis TaxID=3076557 RepID=A0ABZ1E205_9RHOB|nr:hypothetical protein RPE78_14800 [Thioclava sp. FTW29]
MERIKMAFAAILMGAVAVAGLGFGLMALLFVDVIGAVTLLAARVAAPVIVKRMERRMQAQGAPVIWDHVPN